MANSYYINKNWQINTDGDGKEISVWLVMIFMPFIGLLFLMFLPFIGFYLTAMALGKKAASLVQPLLHTSVAPLAAPGTAHLTGHEPGEGKDESERLGELQKEIQSRR